MASTIEMIEQMQANAEKARQAAKDGPRAFVSNSIVLLSDGQRALVRPIYNMDRAIVVPMHDKYKNTDVSLSSRKDQYGNIVAAPIAALCAAHQGKPCAYCVNAKENKLEARNEAFVPVYLFRIEQEVTAGQWEPCNYTDPEGEVKPIKGFRMYRMKQGSSVLSQFMTTFKDEEYSRDITVCNFSIERRGSGLDTKYVCSPKPPKPMDANMKAAIPPLEKFQAILEEIFPIKILERPSPNGVAATASAVKPATNDEADWTF